MPWWGWLLLGMSIVGIPVIAAIVWTSLDLWRRS